MRDASFPYVSHNTRVFRLTVTVLLTLADVITKVQTRYAEPRAQHSCMPSDQRQSGKRDNRPQRTVTLDATDPMERTGSDPTLQKEGCHLHSVLATICEASLVCCTAALLSHHCGLSTVVCSYKRVWKRCIDKALHDASQGKKAYMRTAFRTAAESVACMRLGKVPVTSSASASTVSAID